MIVSVRQQERCLRGNKPRLEPYVARDCVAARALLSLAAMSGAALFPRYIVIDGFLPAVEALALLDHARAHADRFVPGTLGGVGSGRLDLKKRSGLILDKDIHKVQGPFVAAIDASFTSLCRAVGIAPFEIHRHEIGMTAYRDGTHYGRHIDTRTGPLSADQKDVRMLSCVYYLHGEPRGFSGGDLLLHAFNADALPGTAPIAVEPRHNRLVAFPSFVVHEVTTTRVPGDGFADARFAINCWLRRAA
jgi:SM-20-related protein